MRMLFVVLVGCLIAISVDAASFDCSKGTTFIEKSICSDKQLSDLDDLLMFSYKKAILNSKTPDQVKSQQRSWLKNVRNTCQSTECLKQVCTVRIKELVDSITTASTQSPSSISGTYKMDGRDGDLTIHQLSADRIKFELFALFRTNLGEVEGEASLKQNVAVFVDAENDCGLKFYFANNKVSIEQDGSCSMGLNVSASGEYSKVSNNTNAN